MPDCKRPDYTIDMKIDGNLKWMVLLTRLMDFMTFWGFLLGGTFDN